MKSSGGADTNEAAALLRAAARELLPVVIEMGPERARFNSFVSSIQESDAGNYAVFEPVAEALPALDGSPFRVLASAGSDFCIVATRLERDGEGRARLEMSHARVAAADLESPDATVPVSASELLVMVVPGGLHDSSAYIFPIQRIGAELCEIRSSVALEPGQELAWVEIIGDRRLLRSAAAQVLSTSPMYAPDGSQSFSCRLALHEAPAEARSASHDLVTDPKEVHRLLQLAGMMRSEGWYEGPGWGRGILRFERVSADRAELELSSQPHADGVGRNLRIGVELFAVSYELDVRVLSLEGAQLVTTLPLILRRRRRHRRDHRVPIPAGDRLEVSFRNPVTGAVETHALAEVSFFQLTFACDLRSAVIWRGLPLEQAQLTWNNRIVHLGDIVIDHYEHDSVSGSTRCTAAIPNARIADDPDMISLLATLAHPHVRADDGGDFAALHATYLKAGLFGPHMDRNLAPLLQPIKEVWHRLHAEAPDMARTFLHGAQDKPDAAVTILRAWEHAWVLQHFVDTSPDSAGATGKLQHAYLDHLVPRPDGRYLVFFVKTDNRIMNAYLRRFFASTGTPDAVTRSTVELWTRTPNAQSRRASTAGVSIEPCAREDELLIGRASQRCLGTYAAAALSMVPGELNIPDTERRFARAGLERRRECAMIRRAGESTYAVIEERATPGINLTWMLNATWIVPTHRELDHDGACLDAALQHVVDRPAQTATGDRFLNLPAGMDEERLRYWGFEREATLYLYVLTRAGLHRFFHYAASRYGELDARAGYRERRRNSGSGKA